MSFDEIGSRSFAIAVRVRTLRVLRAYGGRDPDPLNITDSSAQEASRQSERLAQAAAEVEYIRDQHGDTPAIHALAAVAYLVLADDPDGFAAILHLLHHGTDWDLPAVLGHCWFFEGAATTWDAVEAELERDAEASQ